MILNGLIRVGEHVTRCTCSCSRTSGLVCIDAAFLVNVNGESVYPRQHGKKSCGLGVTCHFPDFFATGCPSCPGKRLLNFFLRAFTRIRLRSVHFTLVSFSPPTATPPPGHSPRYLPHHPHNIKRLSRKEQPSLKRGYIAVLIMALASNMSKPAPNRVRRYAFVLAALLRGAGSSSTPSYEKASNFKRTNALSGRT